jgi:hypothetical protein
MDRLCSKRVRARFSFSHRAERVTGLIWLSHLPHRLVFLSLEPFAVSDLLEGPSDLQDAAFSDDGHSLTLVAASSFGRTATATSDSSSSKGSQQQGAGKMESRAPSSGASDEAIADADGDDGIQRRTFKLCTCSVFQ